MSNRKPCRAAMAVMVGSMMVAGNASAFIVLDPANLVVNSGTLTAGIITAVEAVRIRKNLDEMNVNLEKVDADGAQLLSSSEVHFGDSYTHYKNVDKSITYNNYYDGGIVVPPPDPGIINSVAPTTGLVAYQGLFNDSSFYGKGSSIIKGANDGAATENIRGTNEAVLSAVNRQSQGLGAELKYANDLAEGADAALKKGGRNAQLQYANAINVENTRQLIRMRELMLHSENASNARGQLDADLQSRQLASGERVRAGSDKASLKTTSHGW